MELDPRALAPGESITCALQRAPALEIPGGSAVAALPFRSHAFYFTHDMWLDDHALFVNAPGGFREYGPGLRATDNALLLARFSPDPTDATVEVTRVTPPGLSSSPWAAVLTHAKDRLFVKREDAPGAVVEIDARDFTIRREFHLPVPEAFLAGGLAVTADDRWLLYDLNLDWGRPLEPRRLPFSTAVVMLDLRAADPVPRRVAEAPFPWIYNHVLPNPRVATQISFARTRYAEYPRTAESDQRLWLADLSRPDHPTLSPLYQQRKKRFLRAGEVVTHECWGRDGTYLTFIVRRKQIKRVDVATNAARVIMDRGPNPWHCDGSHAGHIVFDTLNKVTGIWASTMANDPPRRLCLQHTTMPAQAAHPHPFFSPDLQHVVFNADLTGEPRLYRVLVPPA